MPDINYPRPPFSAPDSFHSQKRLEETSPTDSYKNGQQEIVFLRLSDFLSNLKLRAEILTSLLKIEFLLIKLASFPYH